MRLRHIPPTVTYSELSNEEIAMVSADVEQQLVSANQTLADVAKLGDQAAGASDVIALTPPPNSNPGATRDLLAAVVDMMAAGEEPLEDFTLSAESFMDTSRNIYEQIKALLAKLWGHVKAFFIGLFDISAGLRQKIVKLREELKAKSAEPVVANPTIAVPMKERNVFSVGDKKLLTPDNFNQVLGDIFKHVRNNFEMGPKAIEGLGNAFIDVISGYQPGSDITLETPMKDKVIPALWIYFDAFGIKNFTKNAIGGHGAERATVTSDILAGDARVELRWGKAMNDFFVDRGSSNGVAGALAGLGSTRMHLTKVAHTAVEPHTSVATVPAFKYAGISAALDRIESGLDMMDKFKAAVKTDNSRMSEAFAKAVLGLNERVVKFSKEAEANNSEAAIHARYQYRLAANLANTYSALATTPLLDIARRTMGTFSVLVSMVDRSIAMYKPA